MFPAKDSLPEAFHPGPQGWIAKKQGSLPQSQLQKDHSIAVERGTHRLRLSWRCWAEPSCLGPGCPGKSLQGCGAQTQRLHCHLPSGSVVLTSLGLGGPGVGDCWPGQPPASPSQICHLGDGLSEDRPLGWQPRDWLSGREAALKEETRAVPPAPCWPPPGERACWPGNPSSGAARHCSHCQGHN